MTFLQVHHSRSNYKIEGKLISRWLFLFSLCSLLRGAPLCALEITSVSHLFDIKQNFSQASDVAVASDGTVYVVDGVNQSIKVFDAEGAFLFAFGRAGNGPGQFSYPLGIDIDGNDTVYVADSGNQRIQIFTGKGRFTDQIRLNSANGTVPDPTDIAVDREGNTAFIIDNENHCIYKYDLKTRKRLDTFGKPGTERMEFRYPFLISARDKYLYVVDVINTRVQEITSEGKFVRIIGGWGVAKGQFFRPKGVAVDSRGRVYVSDSYLGVIQVFDEGVFHSVIGDSNSGELWRFNSPVGIFVDKNDRLYVVEMFAERVSVFQINR